MIKLNNKKGFTLIELMIVIAIIGVLAAIAIPNFISYRDKAYCSKVETDVSSTLAALSSYFSEVGRTQLPSYDELRTTEKLFINNPGKFSLTQSSDGAYIVEVGDIERRCPRAKNSSGTIANTFFGYMGTSTKPVWKTSDNVTP